MSPAAPAAAAAKAEISACRWTATKSTIKAWSEGTDSSGRDGLPPSAGCSDASRRASSIVLRDRARLMIHDEALVQEARRFIADAFSYPSSFLFRGWLCKGTRGESFGNRLVLPSPSPEGIKTAEGDRRHADLEIQGSWIFWESNIKSHTCRTCFEAFSFQ